MAIAVWRVIVLLATALVIADATGMLPEADDPTCTDEADGKRCPPTCPTCTCAWHSVKTAPVTPIVLAPVDSLARTVELPQPSEARSRLAPPPTQRPPIV